MKKVLARWFGTRKFHDIIDEWNLYNNLRYAHARLKIMEQDIEKLKSDMIDVKSSIDFLKSLEFLNDKLP